MKRFLNALGKGFWWTIMYFWKVLMFPWVLIAKVWDWVWDE